MMHIYIYIPGPSRGVQWRFLSRVGVASQVTRLCFLLFDIRGFHDLRCTSSTPAERQVSQPTRRGTPRRKGMDLGAGSTDGPTSGGCPAPVDGESSLKRAEFLKKQSLRGPLYVYYGKYR